MMRKMLLAAIAAAMAMMATAAPAATRTITYNGGNVLGPTPLSAAVLTVTTEDQLNSLGGFFITGISGNVDGDAITGLLAFEGPSTCPCFPEGFAALNGNLSISNTLYLANNPFNAGQFLDHGGLGFRSDSRYYNIYGIGGGLYELISLATSSSLDPNDPNGFVDFSVSDGTAAVPEPASWALLILGFGGMGVALRRARRPVPARA